MECAIVREACSASLDGEPAGASIAELAAHLESCRACRQFVAHAERLHSRIGRSAPTSSDVTSRVLAAASQDRRPIRAGAAALRLGLVAVAAGQLALATPGLLFGSDEGAPIHIAHEIGAWDLALAVGFLFAAWRPLRAVGLLPFVAALSAGLLLTAAIDVVHGRAVALTETTHLLEVVGTGMLWMLVARPGRRSTRPPLGVV